MREHEKIEKLSIEEIIDHCNRTCENTEIFAASQGKNQDEITSKTYWEHYQVQGYLEELQKYRAIGTVEECRAAVEKQKEMKAYCDENTCAGCPYHNTSSKDNKCMNDFIADESGKYA